MFYLNVCMYVHFTHTHTHVHAFEMKVAASDSILV